jgi:hypothetical protein
MAPSSIDPARFLYECLKQAGYSLKPTSSIRKQVAHQVG